MLLGISKFRENRRREGRMDINAITGTRVPLNSMVFWQ
jgi:hypothetical protein